MRLPAGIILWYYGLVLKYRGGKGMSQQAAHRRQAVLMLSGKMRGPLPGRKGSPGRACGGLLRMRSALVGRQPLPLNGPEFGPDSANEVGQ